MPLCYLTPSVDQQGRCLPAGFRERRDVDAVAPAGSRQEVLGRIVCGLVLLGITTLSAGADPATDPAARDRAAYAGTWRVVTIEADGNEQDARDRGIVVVNHEDGSWTLSVDGRELSSGTSRIDPLATPPEIDLEVTAGESAGTILLGIYELDGDHRRLCFRGSGGWRPREFATAPGSKAVLARFERQ